MLDFPFLNSIESESSLLLERLWETPKAFLLSYLAKELHLNIVVLTSKRKLLDNLETLYPHVLDFPAWETLPGEEIAPSPDIVGKRLSILHQMTKTEGPMISLLPLQAALQKVPSKKILLSQFLSLKVGEERSFTDLPAKLTEMGYQRAPVVSDKGEFAVRGGIIDLFPLASYDPCRIEFFGDTIEQIRKFDPISQKSHEKIQEILITPADEMALLKEENVPFFDYLPENTVVVFDNLLQLEDEYVALKNLPGAKSSLFLSIEELLKAKRKLFFTKERVEELSDVTIQEQALSFEMFQQTITTKRLQHYFIPLQDFVYPPDSPLLEGLSLPNDFQTIFYTDTPAEEEALKEKLKALNITSTELKKGYLTSGFILQDAKLALIPYPEITKRYKVHREKWRNSYHTPASEFHQLEVGDLVVHFHNGIGKFLGIEKQKNHLGEETEFFIIEYAENSKLFVPLSQSHLISRYIGAKEELPSLHTIGTKKWHQAKIRAQQSIVGYAKDLLHLHAERELAGGFQYTSDSEEMVLFEEDFPFEETADQIQAIAKLKEEMTSTKAMDLLICGDVGYGKTEVAMRAAFKAVVDGGKQVAVLVPTTVLAMQHYETFQDRMGNFPIRIAVLSRFLKTAEVKKNIEDAKAGKIDILIGTHRIISKDVDFNNLGLLIIDEEQRFGVRAKEALKKLKAGVDCITLSATPIPRTLYLSLVGARDLAVINTPPHDRLPIKTIISEDDPQLIKNALLREISRDGQAYVIHNRVETINRRAKQLQELLPTAKIKIVHGQMSPDEIDRTFHAFKEGVVDILLATTIIENGIDIPNANTILIDRADAFGLADLYQLRGRVGRWNKPAYAYFLIPKHKALPEISKKRLTALVESSGHGGGMKLAMRDLEIRGAGDILGLQQSGHVSSIGFHLYCKLLKRTVEALRKKQAPTFFETKMEYPFDANLPDTYIPETSLRLELYHRLGDATTFDQVTEIYEEIVDRFGKPPSPVLWLYHLSRIRVFANANQFSQLKFGKSTLLAAKQKGKKTIEKRFLLPSLPTPEKLEEHVLHKLSIEF